MIPKFMLKKLYIMGSLTQEKNQIIFQMTNNLVTGTITKIEAIQIDEENYTPEKITISYDQGSVNAAVVTSEMPFILEKGKTFTFKISGEIKPGKHVLGFSFDTKEAGKISFDVEDEF